MNRLMNIFEESLIILSLFVITNGYCEDSKEEGDKSSQKVERSMTTGMRTPPYKQKPL